VAQHAVGNLASDRGHPLANRGQPHLGRAVRIRAGIEERRHQRVRVEVTTKVQLGALTPGCPDRPGGQHELAHAGGRGRPRHAEAAGDVGGDLRAEAEQQPALGQQLDLVGGHGDADQRVVLGLTHPPRGVTAALGGAGDGTWIGNVDRQAHVKVHGLPFDARTTT
jgi:hypothetical protein